MCFFAVNYCFFYKQEILFTFFILLIIIIYLQHLLNHYFTKQATLDSITMILADAILVNLLKIHDTLSATEKHLKAITSALHWVDFFFRKGSYPVLCIEKMHTAFIFICST